jgi:hypothetical protein
MMQNSDIKKRLNVLEHRHAPKGEEGGGIPITEEARILLEPWYNALLATNKTFHFGDLVCTPEETFSRFLGNELALTTEDGFCGMDEGVIGMDVAKRVIKQLKEYGIEL